MLHSSDDAIPSRLINEALDRVLASRGFRGSARKRRFLQFIVQETQAGRADRIKAYTIAIDVFDRDPSFDPALDPVVRIQAGRVRRCLEQYYLTEGAADLVQISIPKSGYVPRFVARHDHGQPNFAEGALEEPVETRGSAPPPIPPSRGRMLGATKPWTVAAATVPVGMVALMLVAVWGGVHVPRVRTDGQTTATMHGPSLLVLLFVNGTDSPAQDAIVDGFTEDLIGALVRTGGVLVFGAGLSPGLPKPVLPERSTPSLPNPAPDTDYVLKGRVDQISGQIHITVMLIDAKSRQYLWSDTFHRDFTPAVMIDLRQEITVRVACALARS